MVIEYSYIMLLHIYTANSDDAGEQAGVYLTAQRR